MPNALWSRCSTWGNTDCCSANQWYDDPLLQWWLFLQPPPTPTHKFSTCGCCPSQPHTVTVLYCAFIYILVYSYFAQRRFRACSWCYNLKVRVEFPWENYRVQGYITAGVKGFCLLGLHIPLPSVFPWGIWHVPSHKWQQKPQPQFCLQFCPRHLIPSWTTEKGVIVLHPSS